MHDNAFDVFGKTYTDKTYTAQRNKLHYDLFDENCSQARDDFKTARNAFNRSKDKESRLELPEKGLDITESDGKLYINLNNAMVSE